MRLFGGWILLLLTFPAIPEKRVRGDTSQAASPEVPTNMKLVRIRSKFASQKAAESSLSSLRKTG